MHTKCGRVAKNAEGQDPVDCGILEDEQRVRDVGLSGSLPSAAAVDEHDGCPRSGGGMHC